MRMFFAATGDVGHMSVLDKEDIVGHGRTASSKGPRSDPGRTAERIGPRPEHMEGRQVVHANEGFG